MKYAIDTLKIEKSRLVKALRELRSVVSPNDDEFPFGRIEEHEKFLREIEHAIDYLEGIASATSVH